ncbi:telomere repeats-binding bouquet formation protein 1 isoform X7 [Acanthopagrus latus]|uniref:telomere repeats-binding bouquet formation protein 1 isoform X7 n=1 Tax=Acanthopagrus latus TaxID=8177 RepID=UPI00187C045A|nr:telomere repeats-binding bouquet formation protein 1 isoform X7 [Acanthopagrus latus]
MDKTVDRSNNRNTIRTDLSLLLECLKFQMKCPDLQKQALLAIHSICEKREDTVDLLRDMGGVAFICNLSKSSIVHSDVKETALFTLGTLAEANVYCKNSLCRKEMFAEVAGLLMKEDIPLTQKRVSVYLLSVLVANNKSGQTLAQTTGCLDILLDLFRLTFPLSTEATLRAANATQTYQLWASVSSALCGCVNNPQNEEGQRICVAVFPTIKSWLQQISLPRTEIFQPICSFIAMTVANNSCVQESFSASGGLDTLTLALVRQASSADTSLLSCQLSITISKTLSACITDNDLFLVAPLASGLAQYGMVSHLFSLLASPHLDPEDRLSVLLTLGHCTEASEEHQSQLVQCGGLPLVITLLTEDTSEEVRKAATFILQTCKQATMSLEVPHLMVRQAEGENEEPLTHMEGFRSSARELLRRIDLLEKRQAKEDKDVQEDTDPSAATEGPSQPSLPPALPLQQKGIKTIPKAYSQTSTLRHLEAEKDNIKLQTVRNMLKNEKGGELKNVSSNFSMREEKTKTSWGGRCSVCKGTGALMSSPQQSLEGGRELPTADNLLFKPPAPVRNSTPKEIKCTDEGLQGSEMSNDEEIPVEEQSLSHIRCAGCVLPFEEVTSRTFSSLQSSSCHSCDMHKVLQEATERFRVCHLDFLFRREYQDNAVEQTSPESVTVSVAEPQRNRKNWSGAGKGKSSVPGQHWKKYNGTISLTPLHRGATKDKLTSQHKSALIPSLPTPGPGLTPLKRSRCPEERKGGDVSGQRAPDDEPKTSRDHCSTRRKRKDFSPKEREKEETLADNVLLMRRKRKDFSPKEVSYLLSGVKTFGSSWNSILWSYPFKPGRTNVDLARKYRQLTREKEETLADNVLLMRRKRKDFSPKEVSYLLSGVKTFGSSWNSILWSYPFKPGRTNVDLARKYRQLTVARENLL